MHFGSLDILTKRVLASYKLVGQYAISKGSGKRE